MDFSDGQEIYPHLAEELLTLEFLVRLIIPSLSFVLQLSAQLCGWAHIACYLCVTVVNNVGYSFEYPDYFDETPEEVSCEEQ